MRTQSPPDAEHLPASEVIAEVAALAPRLALACSFQKEESVLLHMLGEAAPGATVFALDTHYLFPETYELWKQFETRFGIAIEKVEGPTPEQQAAEHGPELWKRDPSACCRMLKVDPLRGHLSGQDGWITGIRRDQSPTRANARKLEWDDAFGLWKANPLADWSDKDVWRYVSQHDLPYNPLHDRGYESIGCTNCTLPGAGRAGRWVGEEKTECGLHIK